MSSRSPDEFRLGVRPYERGFHGVDEPEDPHELLHRARRLTAEGHPGAGGAWERAATALRRAGGALTPGDHADALDATALDCRGAALPAAGPLFFRAADLHEQAGQRGKALVSRARALVAGPGPGGGPGGPGATACARLAELRERATALHAVGQADTAETATVRLLHASARADLLDTAPDPVAEAGAVREELDRLLAFAAPHRADPAVLGVLADARALLGRITAPDDPAAALSLLRASIDDHRAGVGRGRRPSSSSCCPPSCGPRARTRKRRRSSGPPSPPRCPTHRSGPATGPGSVSPSRVRSPEPGNGGVRPADPRWRTRRCRSWRSPSTIPAGPPTMSGWAHSRASGSVSRTPSADGAGRRPPSSNRPWPASRRRATRRRGYGPGPGSRTARFAWASPAGRRASSRSRRWRPWRGTTGGMARP